MIFLLTLSFPKNKGSSLLESNFLPFSGVFKVSHTHSTSYLLLHNKSPLNLIAWNNHHHLLLHTFSIGQEFRSSLAGWCLRVPLEVVFKMVAVELQIPEASLVFLEWLVHVADKLGLAVRWRPQPLTTRCFPHNMVTGFHWTKDPTERMR